jgi:hypothetical protein
MRAIVGRILAGLGFAWALFALMGLLSEMTFIAGFIDWAISQSALLKGPILSAVKYVSIAVANYREFMAAIARAFRLPDFSPNTYDLLGIVILSVGYGLWRALHAQRAWDDALDWAQGNEPRGPKGGTGFTTNSSRTLNLNTRL